VPVEACSGVAVNINMCFIRTKCFVRIFEVCG
jgi:hypothetical protein